MNEIKIRLPHKYIPRLYQLPILKAFDAGKKRLVEVAHRRWGKDKTGFNLMIRSTMERVGIYYFIFPTYAQGRKILWEGIDKDGFKFLSHIPTEILQKKPNDTEMKINLINDSVIRIVGSDNIDDIVGTNPVGVVFSEYALQNPQAWDFIRPILRENDGWALFLYTPRGYNHGKTLYDMALNNTEWFCELSTVNETKVISDADIELERKSGMDEDLIQQEFYCSFEGGLQGAYYTKQLKEARADNRICSVPYDKESQVHTAWDLGIGDAMSIWFFQAINNEIHFIDYMETQGEGLTYCISELQKKGFVFGEHYAPHDLQARELSTGKSRYIIASGLGINFIVNPLERVEDGIDACRRIFNRCWFDKLKCEKGLNGLSNYRKEYDEKRKIYYNTPLHDWASHPADAFRTFAMGFTDRYGIKPKRERYKNAEQKSYNPMTV